MIFFLNFIIWLALLMLSSLFAALSLVCCAPVVVLTWISRTLSKIAETME